MDSTTTPLLAKNRIGFHYFPDALHYRESDLNTWVPELHALGAAWLTLVAPPDRAIPEAFLRGLLNSGIEPLLQLYLPFDCPPRLDDLGLLFKAYAEWGVRYVVLYDRPNLRKSWPASSWAQIDLVESFLDFFLPAAELAFQSGLTPVFPPLEPGGDYWDTAFLRAALQAVLRRGHHKLADRLAVGAYAWVGAHPLEWGAGGPERWPGARPYQDSAGQQDHRGFYIFDWYQAIVNAVMHKSAPILLFGAGHHLSHSADSEAAEPELIRHARFNMNLASLLEMEDLSDNPGGALLDPVSPQVLACNFWLLAAARTSPHVRDAWFQPDGSTLPAVGAFRQLQNPTPAYRETGTKAENFLIPHYILLPLPGEETTEWELIKSHFLRDYSRFGFSIEDAAQAARVTIVGGSETISTAGLEQLQQRGCTIEQIAADGTSIAPVLSTLQNSA